MLKEKFGDTKKGMEAYKYELVNSKGMKAVVTDYGATVLSLYVKDKNGDLQDVVLGYDDLASYERGTSYFGAIVGRYANRISNAQITIDGVDYKLEANDNENSLHSGSNGVSGLVWDVKNYTDSSITFTIVSKDLEQGFPGNATIEVTYTVTEDNELAIKYHAVADKATTFNMTNHSYFNLEGCSAGVVYDQKLQINASGYTPVCSAKAIPTGEIAPVEGTPFDFRQMKKIGQDINQENEQLSYGNGYDHNFAIDKKTDGIELVATACAPNTGIKMDVLTDAIGIQLYPANFIAGNIGKGNTTYVDRGAFCLETQYFPNSINEPNFVRPVFAANEAYDTTTIYRFYK